MNILVTGGAGFIGSNFVLYMAKAYPNYRIVVFDNLTYAGNLENLSDIMENPKFRFVKGDITDSQAVETIISQEKPDIVINFAAETHVDRSIDSPRIFTETNVLGVQVLMDSCRKLGVPRFHQISTDEVYGDTPLESSISFNESSPLKPSNPYSASKAAADLLVMSYVRTFDFSATISRCSNNYGPYQHGEKFIPHMIKSALANRPLTVYGAGENIRDWLYVSDHCVAVDKIIHLGRLGEIYNIGGGRASGSENERSNINVAKAICSALGKPQDLISSVADRKGHDLRYSLSCEKIRNQLAWSASVTFENGLERTIDWYKGNMKV